MIVDLNDAAFGRKRFDHLVGHVSRGGAQRAARRMRGDHRSFADRQHVVKSFVGDVGNVDHHAQLVHLGHHLLAERSQAIVRGLVTRGVGPFGVHSVGQGHVADAQREELIESGQAVVDHVAALDAHQHRDLLGFFRGADFVGGGAQHQIVRVAGHGLAYRGNLILSAAHGGGAGNASGNPD